MNYKPIQDLFERKNNQYDWGILEYHFCSPFCFLLWKSSCDSVMNVGVAGDMMILSNVSPSSASESDLPPSFSPLDLPPSLDSPPRGMTTVPRMACESVLTYFRFIWYSLSSWEPESSMKAWELVEWKQALTSLNNGNASSIDKMRKAAAAMLSRVHACVALLN